MSETWDGYPENREQDSEGHVWCVDGNLGVYRWTAAHQWYEDRKGRWVTPAELAADGDTYYGRIFTPAEVEAVRRDEREACASVSIRVEVPSGAETWSPLEAWEEALTLFDEAFRTTIRARGDA
jgi:hypothetical protein